MTWLAKTLILSSCPQRLERDPCMPSITHGLVFFLSATSPLPQSGIQRSPHQPSVPPALLLPGCPPPPAPLVHLPLCPDRGVARRAWRGLTYSGSGVAAVPLRTRQPGARLTLSEKVSDPQSWEFRLFSAGWEGGGVICVSQLPQSAQLSPQN